MSGFLFTDNKYGREDEFDEELYQRSVEEEIDRQREEETRAAEDRDEALHALPVPPTRTRTKVVRRYGSSGDFKIFEGESTMHGHDWSSSHRSPRNRGRKPRDKR